MIITHVPAALFVPVADARRHGGVKSAAVAAHSARDHDCQETMARNEKKLLPGSQLFLLLTTLGRYGVWKACVI
jgi:hypothetical protein